MFNPFEELIIFVERLTEEAKAEKKMHSVTAKTKVRKGSI